MKSINAKNLISPIGVLFFGSRIQMNGISRYQQEIIDSLVFKGIVFDFFDFYKVSELDINKTSLALRLGWRFIHLFSKINSSHIKVFWGPAHKLPVLVRKNISCVVTIHDLAWRRVSWTMPFYRRITEAVLMPLALRRADLVIAVSQSTANDIAEFYPQYKSKIRVVHLAGSMKAQYNLDVSITATQMPDRPYVLFVGTIEPRKNLKRLLDAFSKLPQELRESFCLVIVGGNGWGKMSIQDLIVAFGLEKSVLLLGHVNDNDLARIYKNAYILAMPSLYEGFGLPILEAQSFGVPVVTSDVSSMPEVAGDGAVYVDPFDVVSIRNALQFLLSNQSERDDLSSRALVNSLRFDWDRSANRTLDVFNEALVRRTAI